MIAFIRKMAVAVAVLLLYVLTAMSYRANPAGATCFVATVVVLVFGAFVLSRDSRRPLNRAFFYLSLALGSFALNLYLVHMATVWGIGNVTRLLWIFRNGVLLIPPAGAYFICRFVGRSSRSTVIITSFSLLSTLPSVLLNLAGRYVSDYQRVESRYVPAGDLRAYKVGAVVAMFWIVFLWADLLVQAARPGPRHRRVQYALFLGAGTVMAFFGVLAYLPAFRVPWYPSLMGVAVAFFPLVLGFAVLRFSLFDIKIVIRRTLPYAVGTALIGMCYALILGGLRALGMDLNLLPRGANWIMLLLLVGFGFQPTLAALQAGLDRVFFRMEAELDLFMAQAGVRYRVAESPEQLAGMIARDVEETLGLEHSAVALGRENVDHVVMGRRTFDPSPLLGLPIPTRESGHTILLDEREAGRASGDAAPLAAPLQKAGVKIGVPFQDESARGLLLGWRKLSDLAYSTRDIVFLRALVSQAETSLSRMSAKKEAAAAQELTAAVFESMTNAVALVDQEAVVLSCNRAFEVAFGPSAGKSVGELGLSEALSPEALGGPREIQARGGTYLASTRFLGPDDDRQNTVLVLTDVTDLRRLQEIGRRRAALADIGATISSINHEIMNILSPVNYYLDKVMRGCGPEAGNDALKIVRQRLDVLDALCRELRDYYRDPDLSMRSVQLADVVGSVLSDIAAVEGRGWTAPNTEGLEISLRADPQKLKQVLFNVVKNAWESMRDIPHKRWSVDAKVHDTMAHVQVQDSGVGMSPESAQRAFEPFFTTKKGTGTGLGLAIARRIAEAYGAKIKVRSAPTEGTTVSLSWPLAT